MVKILPVALQLYSVSNIHFESVGKHFLHLGCHRALIVIALSLAAMVKNCREPSSAIINKSNFEEVKILTYVRNSDVFGPFVP